MSSVVETSLRLLALQATKGRAAACAFGRIHKISPRASLGRNDREGVLKIE